MEHRAQHEIDHVAERIDSVEVFRPLSRQERLGRWAKLLDGHNRPIRPLDRTEYLPEHERALVRGDESAVAVAYGDPVFRAAGLKGDRYGDAKTFFELTDQQAHYLLCDCHYHGQISANIVAARLRTVAANA
jgi:hypothetical protein